MKKSLKDIKEVKVIIDNGMDLEDRINNALYEGYTLIKHEWQPNPTPYGGFTHVVILGKKTKSTLALPEAGSTLKSSNSYEVPKLRLHANL